MSKVKVKIALVKALDRMQPQLTLIEYPGFIADDPEAALSSLTYTPAMPAQSEVPGKPEGVQLNFNPTAFFHKPITGTVMECRDKLLVKLRISRPAGSSPEDRLKAARDIQLVDVIGPVRKLVRFRRMAPYQFDVQVPEEWRGLPAAIDSLDTEALREYAEKLNAEGKEGPLYAFPPPFSDHFDFPMSIFGPDMSLGPKTARPKRTLEVKPRLPWMVSFHDADLPRSPTAEALGFMVHLQADTAAAIKEVFERRPVVTRVYVACTTGIRYGDLAKALPVFAYFFVDGPWRNCWVAYGVDPRADAKYRFYQTVQCRNTFVSEGLVDSEEKDSAAGMFQFRGDIVSQHFYQFQYIDLLYAPLAQLVARTEGVQKACQKKDGWYPPGTIVQIRRTMRRCWMELIQAKDPEGWKLHLAAKPTLAEAAEPGESGGEDDEDEEEEEDEDYEYFDEE